MEDNKNIENSNKNDNEEGNQENQDNENVDAPEPVEPTEPEAPEGIENNPDTDNQETEIPEDIKVLAGLNKTKIDEKETVFNSFLSYLQDKEKKGVFKNIVKNPKIKIDKVDIEGDFSYVHAHSGSKFLVDLRTSKELPVYEKNKLISLLAKKKITLVAPR